MDETHALLPTLGFRRAGAIRSMDGGSRCRADIQWDAQGFVVYAHVVSGEVKKFGITSPRLSARVGQNVSTINKVIALQDGRATRDAAWHHRPFDSFKRLAPPAIREGLDIEIWALECASKEDMEATEFRLNNEHRPAWTKEAKASV